MKIAGYNIFSLIVDTFRLDGGAMFGSVPKTLWSKKLAADSENRIQLASRILVLEGHGRKIVVDLGCGRKWDEKFAGIYAIEQKLSAPIHEALTGVTDVILTHLHFDHAGGVTFRDEANVLRVSFSHATHYLQKENLQRAQNPGIRERGSYLSENIEPLLHATIVLTEDSQEILPAVKVHTVYGHTSAMQWVQIGDGKETLTFVADLIPTLHHVSIPYVMGYDLCAETTMREKTAFLEQAVDESWWIVFEHDAENCMAKVGKDKKGGFVIQELGQLPRYEVTAKNFSGAQTT